MSGRQDLHVCDLVKDLPSATKSHGYWTSDKGYSAWRMQGNYVAERRKVEDRTRSVNYIIESRDQAFENRSSNDGLINSTSASIIALGG